MSVGIMISMRIALECVFFAETPRIRKNMKKKNNIVRFPPKVRSSSQEVAELLRGIADTVEAEGESKVDRGYILVHYASSPTTGDEVDFDVINLTPLERRFIITLLADMLIEVEYEEAKS